MPEITAITLQKRKKDRVNIFLDGEFAFSLATVVAAYLRQGQILTQGKIDDLRLEDEYERAKAAAVRLIAQRPRSKREIRQRLGRREFSGTTVERVLDRLAELELVDDLAFANFWVEQRENFKPRSPRALRQELMQKGVERTIIDQVLTEVDAESAARKAAKSRVTRWMGLPEEAFRQKMSGYLQRRGFRYDLTRQITDEMWREARSEQEGDNS